MDPPITKIAASLAAQKKPASTDLIVWIQTEAMDQIRTTLARARKAMVNLTRLLAADDIGILGKMRIVNLTQEHGFRRYRFALRTVFQREVEAEHAGT